MRRRFPLLCRLAAVVALGFVPAVSAETWRGLTLCDECAMIVRVKSMPDPPWHPPGASAEPEHREPPPAEAVRSTEQRRTNAVRAALTSVVGEEKAAELWDLYDLLYGVSLEAMTAAWMDESRAVEGRPDAQENSVALYTMHAAKGLEWPIVMPINTMTRTMAADREVSDRDTGNLYFPVLGVAPTGHEAVFEREKNEITRERVRLWYVACTRAHELLVLPRFDEPATRGNWISLVDLELDGLPALDFERMAPEFDLSAGGILNEQTRERFADEAAAIKQHHVDMVWRAPSRGEGHVGSAMIAPVPQILATDGDDAAAEDMAGTNVRGGQQRGRIPHKLIDEMLTGETADTAPELEARAKFLTEELELPTADDPARGLARAELAQCVVRSLAIPEIAALRPRLVPEVSVYANESTEDAELVTAGIADAIAFGPDGTA